MIYLLYTLILMAVLGIAMYRAVVSEYVLDANHVLWAIGLAAVPLLMELVKMQSDFPQGASFIVFIICAVLMVIFDVALCVTIAELQKERNEATANRAKWVLVQIVVVALLTLAGAILMGSFEPILHFIFILYVFGVYLLADDTCRKSYGKALM